MNVFEALKKFFCFHDFVYGKNIALCRKCGMKQYRHEDDFWYSYPQACPRCNGAGEILSSDFTIHVCPKCNGNGFNASLYRVSIFDAIAEAMAEAMLSTFVSVFGKDELLPPHIAEKSEWNAAYIVAACNHAPNLVAEIERLQKENAELKEEVAGHDALMELQHRRTEKANKLYQEANNVSYIPDLGELVRWLMARGTK